MNQHGTQRGTGKRPQGRVLRDPVGGDHWTRWTDPEGGEWAIRVWWGEVDGRSVPIGMDVRSFMETDDGRGWRSLTDQPPAQVRSTVVRAVPVARIADEQRVASARFYDQAGVDLPAPLQARLDQDQALPTEEPPKRGRPYALTDDQYREVARLYLEAGAVRSPARYVEQVLTETKAEDYRLKRTHEYPADGPAQSARVRKWIAEARRRTYLPPTDK